MPVPPREQLPPPPTVPGLTLMRCVPGSHAYGMDTPESDIDVRGVFVPEKVYLLGCTRHVEQAVLDILRSDLFPGWEGIIQRGGIPVEALPVVQKLTGASDNFIEVLQHEQSFYAAVNEWKRYNNWKRERNPVRAELEAKYGFDVKHASHLVRLMLQGEELMLHGTLTVRLPNANQIRAIRSGVWLDGQPVRYEAVEEFAQQAKSRMQALYESKDCPLPRAADAADIDRLCMELVQRAWEALSP